MVKSELSIEEKKKIGKEYYALQKDNKIEHFLEGTWRILFYSSSLRAYPNEPELSLNAIDMLIGEAEKRFGHVEPAPVSTFLYNRDMTHADKEVKEAFEKANLDKSPDNHPEFAAREAKIFALIKARPNLRHLSDRMSHWRQGKGYFYDHGDHAWIEYLHLGDKEFSKLTLQNIEEQIERDHSNLHGLVKKAAIPFMCSGGYKRDAFELIEHDYNNKDIPVYKALHDRSNSR